jgi:hypothetical protein
MTHKKGRILEDIMKKLALAAALSVAATGAFAGGMVEPVIEPVVIVEDTSSSAGGILGARSGTDPDRSSDPPQLILYGLDGTGKAVRTPGRLFFLK